MILLLESFESFKEKLTLDSIIGKDLFQQNKHVMDFYNIRKSKPSGTFNDAENGVEGAKFGGGMGQPKSNTKLIETSLNTKEDFFEAIFLSEATKGNVYPKGFEYGTLGSNNQIIKSSGGANTTYEIIVRFYDIIKTAKDLDILNDTKITRQDFISLLELVPVKTRCTCPGFHWSGINQNLASEDASINPSNVSPLTKWAKFRGGSNKAYACKHIAGVFSSSMWPLTIQNLSSAFTGKMIKAGILKKKTKAK